jgi:hypothetical protein
MDDKQLEIATIKLQSLVMELIDDGISPMAVAGVVQASATKMYRAMLDDKEFEDLMGAVIDSSKLLDSQTLH